jgi:hypothetical protein
MKRYNMVVKGRSILPHIRSVLNSDMPYVGHHHEYTLDELNWVMKETGFTPKDVQGFYYSYGSMKTAFLNLFPLSTREEFMMYSTHS